ncbi:hypothetical protein GCM10027049_14380 [Mucilaginibacter puniceus]
MIAQTFRTTAINNPYLTIFSMPDDVDFVEGNWDDKDDEDFDDKMEVEDDLNDIRAEANINESEIDPEDEDHLPDDDLQ